MTRRARRARRAGGRGFTLIELMVVVAIIGILATLGLRVTWRRDDARAFARKVQAAVFNGRREAMALGVQRYRPMPPAACSPATAPPDTPRAACMPNVRLRISRDRVEQSNCTLNECLPVNCFPCLDSACATTCATACPAAADCTWSAAPIRTFTAPRGYEITRVAYRVEQPPGTFTSIATFPATPVDLHFRPDGRTDVSAPGTPYGMPSESVQIYLKPVSVADATCQTTSGRCFMILSATTRIAKWPTPLP